MIFSRRGGLAVVEIRGGTCQGCRMHVPPQLFNQIQRNEQVILCPSCQRMLSGSRRARRRLSRRRRGARAGGGRAVARRMSAGGKSGLHRAGWPLTAAPSDRGKVPQKRDRPGLEPGVRVKW